MSVVNACTINNQCPEVKGPSHIRLAATIDACIPGKSSNSYTPGPA